MPTARVIGLIGIGTDISERKRAEDLMALANQRLSAAVAEQTAQLADLSQHLIRVSEDERERLAAELHDELGALHTVITLDLESLRTDLKAMPPDIDDRLQKVLALVQQAREIKRRIIADLRPLLLDHLGLIAAIDHYIHLWAQSSKVSREHRLLAEPAEALSGIGSRGIPRRPGVADQRRQIRAVRREVRISLGIASGELSPLGGRRRRRHPQEAIDRRRSHGIIGMQQRIAHFHGTLEVRRRRRPEPWYGPCSVDTEPRMMGSIARGVACRAEATLCPESHGSDGSAVGRSPTDRRLPACQYLQAPSPGSRAERWRPDLERKS